MPYDIEAAREQVLELLDDETGARYARETGSNTESFRKLYRGLNSSLSACLDDYVAAGGDRFDETITTTTDASTGKVDLAAETVAFIRGVRVSTGQSFYEVEGGDTLAGRLPDRTERDLELTIVRRVEVSSDPSPSDLLVGARSWEAFDEWVCARAAQMLNTKDADGSRAALIASHEASRRASVMRHRRMPPTRPWPERQRTGFYGRLRWLWDPATQELALVYGYR